MANQAAVLQQHPSVQDLAITSKALNAAKVHYHTLVINSGPLHAPSDVAKPKPKVATAKGQGVRVTKHEDNLRRAAAAFAATASDSAPRLPPLGRSSAAGSGSAAVPAAAAAPATAAAAAPPRPASRADAPGRPRSLVSTTFSFEGTDAETTTIYSCSCCNAKPPSSCGVAAAERLSQLYENMTSVSQRGSQRGAGSTVSTSKLKALEEELAREREDRERTRAELDAIRKRQAFLLSKLSPEERKQLQELMTM